jgi:hypothetical protein
MDKVFLVLNSDGMVITACSTLGRAFDFVIEHNFSYDYRELSSIVEIDIDGETLGIHHSFDEIEDYDGD